jgi:hypothetical protein
MNNTIQTLTTTEIDAVAGGATFVISGFTLDVTPDTFIVSRSLVEGSEPVHIDLSKQYLAAKALFSKGA